VEHQQLCIDLVRDSRYQQELVPADGGPEVLFEVRGRKISGQGQGENDDLDTPGSSWS
jgi:hypothetical protein